jgi:hypothetical protein
MRRLLPLLALLLLPAQAVGAPAPGALLQRYAPVLTLAPREPFPPLRVSGFLASAVLEQRAPDGAYAAVGTPARDGSDLPLQDLAGCTSTPLSPCYRLNVEPCQAADGPAALDCYAAHATLPVTYARFQAVGGRIVLQYWFLYEDDLLLAPVAGGALWQAHEGDWEAVAVVLDAGGAPLEAAYSQHCAGQVRPWDEVPLAGGDHPQVFVALGSHANYFTAGPHPIPESCYPPQVGAVLAQFGVTPMDTTGAGAVVAPRVVRIRPHQPHWVGFAGTWGEAQYFHAPPPIGTQALGTSPQGPAQHPLFTDPLATIAGWPAG